MWQWCRTYQNLLWDMSQSLGNATEWLHKMLLVWHMSLIMVYLILLASACLDSGKEVYFWGDDTCEVALLPSNPQLWDDKSPRTPIMFPQWLELDSYLLSHNESYRLLILILNGMILRHQRDCKGCEFQHDEAHHCWGWQGLAWGFGDGGDRRWNHFIK